MSAKKYPKIYRGHKTDVYLEELTELGEDVSVDYLQTHIDERIDEDREMEKYGMLFVNKNGDLVRI